MKPNIVPKNGDMLPRARELRREMTPQERKLWYQFLRRYPVKIYKQRIIEFLLLISTVLAHNWSSNWMEHNTPPNKGFCMTVNEAASFRSTAWMFFVFPIMKWIFSLKQSVKKSIRRFNLAFEAALSRYMHKSSPLGGAGIAQQ